MQLLRRYSDRIALAIKHDGNGKKMINFLTGDDDAAE